ncbi:MOSC domain-containing protein [Myxococcota bacterium]|nr:MOSC domain-containing protein [Myxococcota bacterium]MBU1535514.1 MOSC domain-containing protein [Myxococcota bacterium]
MTGEIVSLWCATLCDAPLLPLSRATVIAQKGIEGDRYFDKPDKKPGEEITFIEEEMVDRVNKALGLQIHPSRTRRNVVTRNIDLNALVGKRFHCGSATFEGVELCEPCAYLGRLLQTPEVPPRAIIAAFTGRGGLRARIVASGAVKPGDIFNIVP